MGKQKPWVVTKLTDKGAGHWYRYHVEGINHSHTPPQSFSWSVPDIDDPQFDLTAVCPLQEACK